MTTAYLTPKPTGDGHALPACPPPPEAAHETIDVPAPRLPPHLDLDDALSPCGGEGFILVAPGVPQRPGAKFLPAAARRSHNGRGAVASPFLKPRPRPSRNGEASDPDAETSSAFSLTPSLTSAFSPTPSFYSLKPKISKRPSFSRVE